MDFKEKLQFAYTKLKAARRVLVVGHTSPDADALASVGAMLEIARSLGLEVQGYADKKPLGAYSFIPNENLISAVPPTDLTVYDLILAVDCGSIARTGLEKELRSLIQSVKESSAARRPYLMEFDHHSGQEAYADLEVRAPEKASTTEIIYYFLHYNYLAITKTLADCILIGLVTDTGHFLHANSSREAMVVASEMLLGGASLPKIIDHTVNNKSYSSLKVWGRALENMRFNSVTGLVSSALTATELTELLPAGDGATDLFGDIASFLSTLSGVNVALFLREENGRVKGSLRTNSDDYNVSKIAGQWGGGGHTKSAGFSIPGRLERTATGWKVVKF